MLSLRGPAEIRAVAARVEYHGDDREKGVTIRLHFAAVPLQVPELSVQLPLSHCEPV